MMVASFGEAFIMQAFLKRHSERVVGVLSGFDRVLFRGTHRSLEYADGIEAFLATHRVLFKDFGKFAEGLSNEVKEHAKAYAQERGRPLIYLPSATTSKEDTARRIMKEDRIQEGLICVLTCVEPCKSLSVRRNGQTKQLELVSAIRKCLFIYYYFADPELGLFHVRLQTWLPMPMQVCLNGREYLACRMRRAGIGFEQRDNCFTRIDDLPRAQKMLGDLERRKWAPLLSALARRLNPLMHPKHRLNLRPYYWTIRESEYATDVIFRSSTALTEIYPSLIKHAIEQFDCQNIMRFLGRRTNSRFNGEASSNVKHRLEGVRIKHWVEENSIKMYDKEGSVLRVETTINNPRRFRVLQRVIRKGNPCLEWIPMRKSVADTSRRAELGLAANERYLEALGVVGVPAPTRHLLDPVSKPITREGRSYRALRPIAPEEAKLFGILLRGEFLLQGFRNKDVRRRYLPSPGDDPLARKQASGKITRLFRLLRAHGLIKKVSHTSYYRVTSKGNEVMTTALKLRELEMAKLAA
jgi:hypothetical protein